MLEPGLQGFDTGRPISAGACLHASWLLKNVLEKFAECKAIIRGGGDGDGGARDVSGDLQGHYWVEAVTSNGARFVADITADQFGHQPVVILPLNESAGMYHPGDQEAVDEAVALLEEDMATMQLGVELGG